MEIKLTKLAVSDNRFRCRFVSVSSSEESKIISAEKLDLSLFFGSSIIIGSEDDEIEDQSRVSEEPNVFIALEKGEKEQQLDETDIKDPSDSGKKIALF